MDYRKFLREKNDFKLTVKNDYIKQSMDTLKNIEEAEYILFNHHKFSYKIEIDDYFAYFLKEKNDFIQSFHDFIVNSKKNPEISEDRITVYKQIFNYLKSNLDNLITNFKIIKQNIYKKSKQQERFNEQKFNFFSEKEEDHSKVEENEDQSLKAKVKKKLNEILPIDFESLEEKIKDKYKEASNVVDMLMDKEKQNYEKTKRILFDLSSLITNVQKKMHEQSEMTKNILFNSLNSVLNIEQGNKHLTKAKEYQKGRGFIIGLIFIILGLFLLLSDR